MRASVTMAVGILALCLAGCDADSASTGAPSGHPVVDPDAELVAHGILMQREPDGEVEICVGGVAESLPPQCGGPVLEGEFSWEDVDARSQSGVTWTDETYYAVGHYTAGDPDPAVGALGMAVGGTLTLSRAVSLEPPEGYTPRVADETVQSDPPTEQDVMAAARALDTADPPLQLLGIGIGGATDVPSVNVPLADPATVDRILEIVEPWLAPDQLRIWSALHPLDAAGHG